MKSQKIEIIRKKHPHEWLLIRVDKMDESTTTPLTGYLLAHSPNRDKIYSKMVKVKELTLTTYSEDRLPKGLAVAFYA